MSKETHELSINAVPTWDKAVKIPMDKFTTAEEAISAGHFKDAESVLHAAYATRFVRVNRAFRDLLESEPVTSVESLRNIGNQLTYGERVAGTATGGKKVAEKVAAKVTAIQEALGLSAAQLEVLYEKGIMARPDASAPVADAKPAPTRRPASK